MEYQNHKTRTSIVIDLKKVKMARINRSRPASHYRRKVMVEGYNQRQGPPPIRNTFRIFHRTPNTEHRTPNTEHRTPNTEHRTPNTEQFTFADSIARLIITFGVRGVNNAPPSARERERNVHQFVQRENQTESIAV